MRQCLIFELSCAILANLGLSRSHVLGIFGLSLVILAQTEGNYDRGLFVSWTVVNAKNLKKLKVASGFKRCSPKLGSLFSTLFVPTLDFRVVPFNNWFNNCFNNSLRALELFRCLLGAFAGLSMLSWTALDPQNKWKPSYVVLRLLQMQLFGTLKLSMDLLGLAWPHLGKYGFKMAPQNCPTNCPRNVPTDGSRTYPKRGGLIRNVFMNSFWGPFRVDCLIICWFDLLVHFWLVVCLRSRSISEVIFGSC